MACNKNKYRPNPNIIKNKINLGIKKYNNDDIVSKIDK